MGTMGFSTKVKQSNTAALVITTTAGRHNNINNT